MNSSFRRLAKDHALLRRSLPPNYLYLESDSNSSLPDDLTQLSVLITGADGTPYSQGVWQLHLKIPADYPRNPPKATFKTRIYHPNVDEQTGAVCLETLKRDWDPKLTLKDILVTLSCLLIQPNPDSALNAAAGALIQEDYEAFSRQARLMTRIHAPIPKHLQTAVREAKQRGEEDKSIDDSSSGNSPTQTNAAQRSEAQVRNQVSDTRINNEETKENAMLCSAPTIGHVGTNSRNSILGKRSLREALSAHAYEAIDREINGSTASDASKLRQLKSFSEDQAQQPARRSPKLMHTIHSNPNESEDQLKTDEDDGTSVSVQLSVNDEKENIVDQTCSKTSNHRSTLLLPGQPAGSSAKPPSIRIKSTPATFKGKLQPRVGVRRL